MPVAGVVIAAFAKRMLPCAALANSAARIFKMFKQFFGPTPDEFFHVGMDYRDIVKGAFRRDMLKREGADLAAQVDPGFVLGERFTLTG